MVKLLVSKINDDFSCVIENQEIAKRNGAIEQDVEFCEWNLTFYLSGYLPKKPQEMIKEEEIQDLKKQLDDTDYKIIKCIEYSLTGKELPYDIEYLHKQRQAIRDRITELEG